jgi:hypothetical protein
MLRFYSNLMIIFCFIKNMSQFLPVALPLELGALQINLCQGTNEDHELDGVSTTYQNDSSRQGTVA